MFRYSTNYRFTDVGIVSLLRFLLTVSSVTTDAVVNARQGDDEGRLSLRHAVSDDR